MNPMRRTIWFTLLIVAATSAEKIPLAVADLMPQGIDLPTTVLISDRLRSELFETGKFAVMERGQMDEVLKEQGFQQSGCVSDACAIEVGQLLGVTHMVVGSIGKVGKTFTVNTRLLEVRTGKVVATVSTDCKCEIDDVLMKSTREVATAIVGKITAGETAKAPSDALDRAEQAATRDAGTAKRKRAGWAVRISSGVIAAGGAVAGLVFNGQAGDHIDKAAAIKESTTSADFTENAAAYADEYEQAETSMLLRNVSYIAAGIGLVGFGVSFAF